MDTEFVHCTSVKRHLRCLPHSCEQVYDAFYAHETHAYARRYDTYPTKSRSCLAYFRMEFDDRVDITSRIFRSRLRTVLIV